MAEAEAVDQQGKYFPQNYRSLGVSLFAFIAIPKNSAANKIGPMSKWLMRNEVGIPLMRSAIVTISITIPINR